ncbi:Glycosyl hydrolases 36 protein [Dioscorea alata]|uniref:Glycosyl hydrolases 36 protein n=1 Tax=Dioscorea alata TaxID=55571 RepID=A0ACB7WM93_DIOAL|nr:Glycosyl hydrolases 36 protein [Dioscorea alata]
MTIGAGISVSDGNLNVLGTKILSDVHENIVFSSACGDDLVNGAFIGVSTDRSGCHNVFPVGKLQGLRFMCTFRFKLWGQSSLYVVFLPIVEGSFRAVLQGNENDELEICLESGCPSVQGFEGTHLVFMAAGNDPFDVITNAVKMVERHLQTFSHREKKKMPDMLNWFGWCTWDAFYTQVTAEGVCQGLESFEKGGIPAKFVIIDDGWQSVGMDASGVGFESDNSAKYVYVSHAITGYWGGVRPGVTEMEHYESKMAYPVSSPGVKSNEDCEAFNSIASNGLGLVNPEKVFNFYDELHSYLASTGVDGVKVDVQNILETLGAGHGGRVQLARKYHQALEASIARNFLDNGIISCMSHNTDNLYSSKRTAVVRASDDFWPKDPASHTIHIASVAYNTVFLGEFMQPDWDMFHVSKNGKTIAFFKFKSSMIRAVGGCAIYVSDKPGNHDFDLLKKLVLPDGSILRAKLPGRPTRDCLFADPARDGENLLKIWNLNDHCGVIGVFNCQGAGWCRVGKKNLIHDEQPGTITEIIRSKDVDYLSRVADDDWKGNIILYSHIGGELTYLPKDASLPVTLKSREYEVFTVVPVKEFSNGASFAPIGLIKMFNSGGAVKELEYETEKNGMIKIKVRGPGVFGAYSLIKPKRITVDAEEVEFIYNEESVYKELQKWSVSVELW